MSGDGHLAATQRPESARRFDRDLATLANRQHGVVSLAQLLAIGLSSRAVRHRMAAGRLHRLYRGVFAVGHTVLTRQGHWMAAVLACGDGTVLSHAAAGACLGIRDSAATRLDVSVPGRAGRSRTGLRVHRGEQLAPDEFAPVGGVPCTTVARTLLDLAAILDQRGLERAVERAERLELFDLWQVGRLLVRHRGRRGVARLRGVLAEWDPDLMRTRSELEVLFLRLIIRAGIERPVVNGRIELAEMEPEVDFHWPRHRLVIETDGDAFHRNPRVAREDAERDQALATAGWRVRRLTWDDVTKRPERALLTVRNLLTAPRPTSTGR